MKTKITNRGKGLKLTIKMKDEPAHAIPRYIATIALNGMEISHCVRSLNLRINRDEAIIASMDLIVKPDIPEVLLRQIELGEVMDMKGNVYRRLESASHAIPYEDSYDTTQHTIRLVQYFDKNENKEKWKLELIAGECYFEGSYDTSQEADEVRWKIYEQLREKNAELVVGHEATMIFHTPEPDPIPPDEIDFNN